MKVKEAVVLAGGKGTRLKSLVKDIPKPMAVVNGKPFLQYVLDYLINQGIETVVLAVGYKHKVISNYFGSIYKSLKVLYSIEYEPLGTGGCVKKASSLIKGNMFFVLNGDTLFKMELQSLILNEKFDIVIASKEMYDFDRYGSLKFKGKNILEFQEKRYCLHGYINGGVYLLQKYVFEELKLPNIFSIEKDIFERNVNELIIKGVKSNNYFIDIGVPNDYIKAQKDFINE